MLNSNSISYVWIPYVTYHLNPHKHCTILNSQTCAIGINNQFKYCTINKIEILAQFLIDSFNSSQLISLIWIILPFINY